MPANILKLPAYVVSAVEHDEHDYHLSVEVKQPPTVREQRDALSAFDNLQWD